MRAAAPDPEVCASPPVNGVDQRGWVRPGTGYTNCSIGAYEYCVGDCNGNGQVTIEEPITMVNIALGNAAITTCAAGDADGDGEIDIEEIIGAVTRALERCMG